MSPYISRFVMDFGNAIYTLHFILVKAISLEDMWVIMPIGGYFVDCEKSFCAVFNGCGELIESLFSEIATGVERGVYVIYRVDIGDSIVCVCFKFDEMVFEQFHTAYQF